LYPASTENNPSPPPSTVRAPSCDRPCSPDRPLSSTSAHQMSFAYSSFTSGSTAKKDFASYQYSRNFALSWSREL
jgi:hypothetical protein